MSAAPGRLMVVDTNVVVAGLLTADSTSPVSRILDGMLMGAFPFVISETLLAEYHAVLIRPKLLGLHGLTEAEVESILTDVALNASVLNPASNLAPPAPDPGDQLLWDLLAARSDLVLVTGDKRLLEDASMRGRVITPREFVQQA